MSYQEANLYISYKHIKATTPEKLEEMMLSIQVRSKKPVNFTAPSYTKGKWHTWFQYDHSQELRGKGKLDLEEVKNDKQ